MPHTPDIRHGSSVVAWNEPSDQLSDVDHVDTTVSRFGSRQPGKPRLGAARVLTPDRLATSTDSSRSDGIRCVVVDGWDRPVAEAPEPITREVEERNPIPLPVDSTDRQGDG